MVASGYHLAFADAACLAGATRWLSPELLEEAPVGLRRAEWLAARILLAMLLNDGPLPKLERGAHGKPFHPALPAFNISNTGSSVAVLVGEGDVGCDIEFIRPRARFMAIARHSFGAPLCEWLESLPEDEKMAAFWRLWTAHEAVLKQRGGTVWQMNQLNLPLESLCPPDRYLHHACVENRLIACCGEQPFPDSFAPVMIIV